MQTRKFRVKVAAVTPTCLLAGAGDQRIDRYSNGSSRKPTKAVLAALVVTAVGFFLIPSSIGAASGGGTVAGKCGTFKSISASTVQLSASGAGYTVSPLQIRGEVFNCSIYLQSYWIDFDEPTNTNATCTVAFSLFNALLLSSGSSQGWTAPTNVTPNGVASPVGCVGAHTVRAVLKSRTDGTVLDTVFVNYVVARK
jgi:hypothetical protein